MNDLIQSRSALIQSIPECIKTGKIRCSKFQIRNSFFSDSDPPLQIDESKIEQIVNTSGKHEYVHEQDKSVFVHFNVDGAILCGKRYSTDQESISSIFDTEQGATIVTQGHDPFIFERFFQKINQI